MEGKGSGKEALYNQNIRAEQCHPRTEQEIKRRPRGAAVHLAS